MTFSGEHEVIGDLLAIDPGIVSPGWALFRRGRLIAAGNARVPAPTPTDRMSRCTAAGYAVLRTIAEVSTDVSTIACEWPQIYAASKSKGDPNDLPYMVGVDMVVATVLELACTQRGRPFVMRSYQPSEWIGQCPKTRRNYWTSPRGVRIRSRLSPTEWTHAPDQNDAGDAIGIGLHSLGRLGVARVLSST